jgi:hypothetical protein
MSITKNRAIARGHLEVDALSDILRALEKLTKKEQARVIAYAADKQFGWQLWSDAATVREEELEPR